MQEFSEFSKTKEYIICFDSDGCVIDTMNSKHIYCFGPCLVGEWKLEQWSDAILARWNEINLYTATRGINRFKGLAIILQEINSRYTPIQDLQTLVNWVEHSEELSNHALREILKNQKSPLLLHAMRWSERVNEASEKIPEEQRQPFSNAFMGLKAARKVADIAIISSANAGAVQEEWNRSDLMKFVDISMTQEAGSKKSCLSQILKKGYQPDHVLMVGDAPGDKSAAEDNGVLFYPILVGRENESWNCFADQILESFLDGRYAGTAEEAWKKEFDQNLL